MSAIPAKSVLFNVLAERFLKVKEEEREAIADRRQVGEDILSLPEIEENKREKGSITLRSDTYEIGVTFVQSESRDMAAISAVLPPEALKRVFPSIPTFTQTGLNAYLKELDAQGMADAKAAKLAKKIRDTLKAHTTTKPGSTQFSVSKIDG